MMGGSDFHGVLISALAEPSTLEPATLEPATLEPATLEPATLEPATLETATLEPAIQESVTVIIPNISEKGNSIEEPVVTNIISFSVNKNGNILVLNNEAEIAEIRPYTLPNHLQKELECMRKEIGTEKFIAFLPKLVKIYAESRI
jgi:hypothetical protein